MKGFSDAGKQKHKYPVRYKERQGDDCMKKGLEGEVVLWGMTRGKRTTKTKRIKKKLSSLIK